MSCLQAPLVLYLNSGVQGRVLRLTLLSSDRARHFPDDETVISVGVSLLILLVTCLKVRGVKTVCQTRVPQLRTDDFFSDMLDVGDNHVSYLPGKPHLHWSGKSQRW